ncbi:efflux RND transporter periplasmic adaptor subunit [Pseudomonas sp. Snoq117.2]|uniref:efflux RND transporter periplasmic adaptor subunit n=1 Tax=Pseudomonas sp. Snoq117.2 TaxID=1500302 RepID=UPI0008CF5625|nr:efflux RND transporter periplasmic adaptor subunit [Pseudomonas sp. Snoq117.2]SEP37440.1 membrane fusion protein, cobalt-zinc-cadmium efflux system [Pseudomonas sp. Snoq117.2]
MTMISLRPRLLLLITVLGIGLPFARVQAGAGHDHPESSAPVAAKVADANAGTTQPRTDPAESKEDHEAVEGAHADGEEGHAEGEIELTEEQIRAAGIETQVVTPVSVGASLSLPGEIRFDEDRTAHVVSRTPGIIEEVKANLGDRVRKGQVLAVIASEQLSEVRSELATAQQRLQLARTLYAREQSLWQERISAEQDLLQARQTLQEAEIAVRNARQKAQALGGAASALGGSRYELRAPFDGVVVEKHLVLGERVDETSNLFTLTDLSRVWATFAVPARDLDRVTVGRTVEVIAGELDSRTEGTVAHVGNLLGEQTRAATARVTLANPEGAWRPGLFVTVRLDDERRDKVLGVPSGAVHVVEDRTVVFVRTADGFQATPVVTGVRDGERTEIRQGLSAGQVVADRGSFILKSELGKGSAEHSH